MRTFWKHAACLGVAAFGLSGCTPEQTPPAARGVAASFVAGRAFDRAQSAIKRNNTSALERAGSDLRRAASAGSNPRLVGALATNLAFQAGFASDQARQLRGDQRNRLEEDSNAKYRAALAFTPENQPEKSLDPPTLNALGYFLADKGSTRADFERAAVLTRAAYLKWDVSGKSFDFNELNRATGPQDSYAWALFKLGRYEQARREAEKVWELSRGMGQVNQTADIPFHLAEIYRALGQNSKARETYEAALSLSPGEETRTSIERGLQSLDLARV